MKGIGKQRSVAAVARWGAIALTVASVCSPALASRLKPSTSLRPAWLERSASTLGPNDSFLSSVETSQAWAATPEKYLADEEWSSLRQRYVDMNRNYEFRRNFNLTSMQDEQDHNSQIQGFVQHDILEKVGQYKGNEKLRSLQTAAENAAERDENLRVVAAPITVVGVVAQRLYSGKPVTVLRRGETRVISSVRVPTKTSSLELKSPLVDGRMEYAANAPGNFDPTQADERYRVSMSRRLPFSVSSGVSYGATTSTLTASLSRPLVIDNLTCSVGTNRALDSRADRRGEETVKLDYGISF